MIQFQQAPTATKSDSLVDLIEAERVEKRSQAQTKRQQREEERNYVEEKITAHELEIKSSRSLTYQATFLGLNMLGFAFISFWLRSVFIDAGHNALGIILTIFGTLSLTAGLFLTAAAIIGWTDMAYRAKHVRALKRRVERGLQ